MNAVYLIGYLLVVDVQRASKELYLARQSSASDEQPTFVYWFYREAPNIDAFHASPLMPSSIIARAAAMPTIVLVSLICFD